MEYRYYRELKHNYLIVKEEDDSSEKIASYQARILEKGKLSGFIPCNLRNINNENYLYYEINSMQSIRDRFAVRGMDFQQLRKLFESLKTSLESLSEYLLGMENVILDTKSVFTDLTTGEFKFMYCPFGQEQASFAQFVDNLLEIVDHDDEKAVELIYACSEMAQLESVLALDCLEQILARDEEMTDADMCVECEESDQEAFNYENDVFEDDDYESETKVTIKRSIGMPGGKLQIIFGILFMGLLVAMMYIRMNYILSKEENALSIIVIILSMVTGLVAFISGIRDLYGKEKPKAQKELKQDEEEFEPFMIEEETGYKRPVRVTCEGKNNFAKQAVDSSFGETVVLTDDDSFEKSLTLYSRNTEKTIRISLTRLPVTVGKMAGCVDSVIDDRSVSRIHCRFMKEDDGKVFVMDLGSTNGTFRNGKRLDPQEKNYVEEGDEIRIGRVLFDCN